MAAVGGFNLVEFRREDDIAVHRLPISQRRIDEFEQHLFLVYTGITRKASEIVAKQLKSVDNNGQTLAKMSRMTTAGWDILVSNRSLTEFGALLHEAWLAKRSLDASISSTQIDSMYKSGLSAGALGGKLLGAGGGGFLLFFAPPETHPSLSAAFPHHATLTVRINAPGSEVIFA